MNVIPIPTVSSVFSNYCKRAVHYHCPLCPSLCIYHASMRCPSRLYFVYFGGDGGAESPGFPASPASITPFHAFRVCLRSKVIGGGLEAAPLLVIP